ncbi:MAG TPA: hypothetical protein VH306_10130 [Gaiellaceae bacterium]
MRRALPVGLLVLAAAGALAAVATSFPSQRTRAVAAFLLFLGAVGVVFALTALRRARRTRRSAFELALAARSAEKRRLRALDRMEHDVVQSLANPLDLHRRLRPVLRDVAAQRLAAGHGIDLDRRPEAAQALLGDELWELVRPERPEPDELTGTRLDAGGLDRILTRLETV